MGIVGLWDVLGQGEVWHIADYAANHFKSTGRPLRIAVDEANWRFNNVTPEQVERIREAEPRANPVEKNNLFRIVRLWRLNIQLLFVFDGMQKPAKPRRAGKGPEGGEVDQERVRLLQRLFRLLKVPFHQAPGEAEAECARLQRLGVVDAVWSDDGDSFMFGCQTLIKAHKIKDHQGNEKRVHDHVRIYREQDMEKHDFDASSLVLFALLSGGDYDPLGLKGCGVKKAKEVCQRSWGLAGRIVNITQPELRQWRADLRQALRLEVPNDFPKAKVLDGYRSPAISTDEQCQNLSGLRGGWIKPIDQEKLRVELRERYNFSTREYLKHLGPVFLARALADATSPESRRDNLLYGVHLKSNVRRKDGNGNPVKCEVNIKYLAHELVDIDLTSKPAEEDWSKFAAKDGTPYNPKEEIEIPILECLLEHGLPPGSWAAPARGKKRKSSAGDQDESDAEVVQGQSTTNGSSASTSKTGKTASQNNNEPRHDPSQRNKSAKKWHKAEKENSPAPAPFRLPDVSNSRLSSQAKDVLYKKRRSLEQSHVPNPTVSQAFSTATTKAPFKFKPLQERRSLLNPAKTDANVENRQTQGSKKKKDKETAPRTTTGPAEAARKPFSKRGPQDASSVPSEFCQKTQHTHPFQSRRTPQHSSQAIRPSQTMHPPKASATTPIRPKADLLAEAPATEFVPGQAMEVAQLRALRLAALSNRATTSPAIAKPPLAADRMTATAPAVIDLT